MGEGQTRDRGNSGRCSYEVVAGVVDGNEVGYVELLGTQEELLPGLMVNCDGKCQSSGYLPEERAAAYRAGPRFISSLVFDCEHDVCSYGQVGFPLEVPGHIVEFTTAAASQNGQKNR